MRFYGKKRSAYTAAELAELQHYLNDYASKSRDMETKAADDLQKHLWLGNAAAVTISVGYIQIAGRSVSNLQYVGASMFVAGIAALVVLKYLGAYTSSRDRFRFDKAHMAFEADTGTDDALMLNSIRDITYNKLHAVYLLLQYIAGLLFLMGCMVTVLGVI
jgi:hypothetical protein